MKTSEEKIEYIIGWIKDNPEKVKKYQKKWREDNLEKKREYLKEYYKRNKVKIKGCNKEWVKNNPDKKRIYDKRTRIKKKGYNTVGEHSSEEWKVLKERYKDCCAICGGREPFISQWYKWLTEDHIIPLSRDGVDNIENIQPLCFSCNAKKGIKIGQVKVGKQ